jgi:hypothetical protein
LPHAPAADDKGREVGLFSLDIPKEIAVVEYRLVFQKDPFLLQKVVILEKFLHRDIAIDQLAVLPCSPKSERTRALRQYDDIPISSTLSLVSSGTSVLLLSGSQSAYDPTNLDNHLKLSCLSDAYISLSGLSNALTLAGLDFMVT